MADGSDNVIPIDGGKKRNRAGGGPVNMLAAGRKPPDWPAELPDPGTAAFEEWRDGPAPPKGDSTWKFWMHARRARDVAAGAPQGNQGSPRKRRPLLTAEEIKERALELAAGKVAEDLLKASHLLAPLREDAVAMLALMLNGSDATNKRFAIKTILEFADGKPAQTIVNEGGDKPVRVVYETGVLSPLPPFVPGAGIESPGDAIALADRDAPDGD